MDPALIALASAAGTAVAQAAGTDAWQGFRQRLARLFGRGPAPEAAEETALGRLDRTAAELEGADVGTAEAAVSSWTTRVRDLLDEVDAADQDRVVTELRELIRLACRAHGGTTAGDRGVAIGGDVHIEARDGSAAAMHMGDVTLGKQRPPGMENT